MSSVCLGIVSGKEGMARELRVGKSEWCIVAGKLDWSHDCEGVYMSAC